MSAEDAHPTAKLLSQSLSSGSRPWRSESIKQKDGKGSC